jgi:DNA (cytosine-5)-methyltransferase 1
MSWLYSQALVAEYLGENFLDGEQSALSNGKPTQQAYCAPGKMTDFSRLSRFGMTFKPLTQNLGEVLLMLYLEGFHAKTSVPQEKAQELMENEAECGEKWLASFVKYDPDSCLWKTHQCSLLGDLDEFSETWPQWGLMRDGECWEQKTLEQTIRGTEFGLSPNGVDSFHTPNTTGLDGGSNSRKALKKRQMFPTPNASDGKGANMKPDKNGIPHDIQKGYLRGIVKVWPTSRATDYKGATSPDAMSKAAKRGFSPNLPEATAATTANGGQLNPIFCEWLMGWPLGWTELKPLEMDKSHFVPPQHGDY